MHTRIRFQGLRRRSLLVVVVLALLLSLLPTAAFAAAGGHRGPQHGGQQVYAPQHQQYNRHAPQRFERPQPDRYNYCADTYRVRRGDTLSEIARHHGVSVRALADANRIGNPNRIYAGTNLCLPR